MRVLELHMAASVVQRSKGRSAVAAAAYISGETLTDERTGEIHRRGKGGVEFTGLALSDQAPEWAHDRQALWSRAELREKHPRAQTGRSFIVNFPHEFSQEQRREASMKIAHMLADRYRGGVDYAVHIPDAKGSHLNHHGHFLMTARPFENGDWAKNKDRVLDDLRKGPKEYKILRENVAGVINNIAVRERMDVYVEHLSFAERGLDREPTKHLGPAAMAAERRGESTDRGDLNRAAQARNAERDALREESNVIDIEIARELVRQKHQAVVPPQWKQAYNQLYVESHGRRAALLEELETTYGATERQSREEVARLQASITGGNFFTRAWRYVSGQTREDKHALAEVTTTLQTIQARKEQAFAAFEADRRMRFEAFHQRRAAQEQALHHAMDRAVGDHIRTRQIAVPPAPAPLPAVPRSPQLVPPASPAPVQDPAPKAAPVGEVPPSKRPDYEARRDAFFGRMRDGKPRRESELKSPAPSEAAADKPAAKPRPDYEARRDAFFARTRGRRPVPIRETPESKESELETTKKAQEANPLNAPARPGTLTTEQRRAAFMDRLSDRSAERGLDRGESSRGESGGAEGPSADPGHSLD